MSATEVDLRNYLPFPLSKLLFLRERALSRGRLNEGRLCLCSESVGGGLSKHLRQVFTLSPGK